METEKREREGGSEEWRRGCPVEPTLSNVLQRQLFLRNKTFHWFPEKRWYFQLSRHRTCNRTAAVLVSLPYTTGEERIENKIVTVLRLHSSQNYTKTDLREKCYMLLYILASSCSPHVQHMLICILMSRIRTSTINHFTMNQQHTFILVGIESNDG